MVLGGGDWLDVDLGAPAALSRIIMRHVKLDITAPQTDPSTVAARIEELEMYAR